MKHIAVLGRQALLRRFYGGGRVVYADPAAVERLRRQERCAGAAKAVKYKPVFLRGRPDDVLEQL